MPLSLESDCLINYIVIDVKHLDINYNAIIINDITTLIITIKIIF